MGKLHGKTVEEADEILAKVLSKKIDQQETEDNESSIKEISISLNTPFYLSCILFLLPFFNVKLLKRNAMEISQKQNVRK